MNEVLTERSGSVLRVTLNRPAKKNAMTSSIYVALAGVFNNAAKDDRVRVVLWDAAGDSFSAGNDIEDFLTNPPGAGESPQALLANALVNLDKPIIAAVRGVAIGGGTTLLTHCDFVYASETAKFQLPFVNLGLVPEFGSSWSLPARAGHLRAAELIMLGLPFDAGHAAELGLVTRVVPDDALLATATEPAEQLAAKPPVALQSCKRLMKRFARERTVEAIKAENEEFAARVRSPEAKQALTAFLNKRRPAFTKSKESATAK
jgi:enoyl-CoA hydratase/carnithine racemase